MKKSISVLTAAVLAASVLTACGGNGTEAATASTSAAASDTGSETKAEAEGEDAKEAEETTAAAGELKKIIVGADRKSVV